MMDEERMEDERKEPKKTVQKAAYILIMLILFAVLIYSVYQIAAYLKESFDNWKLLDEITEQVVVIKEPSEEPDTLIVPKETVEPDSLETEAKPEKSVEEGVPITVDFDRLRINNEDVKAWIYCEDTLINYPVAQAADNDYYLYRLLNGTYNRAGTIFMECINREDFSDWNTLVYGHNMKNNTMFGTLTDYRDQEYYDEHPVWYLLTPNGDYRIELISGFVTDTSSVIYSIPQTQEAKNELVDAIMRKSNFKTNATISPQDKLITFSTCTYDYDEARYVLIGILKEVNEE